VEVGRLACLTNLSVATQYCCEGVTTEVEWVVGNLILFVEHSHWVHSEVSLQTFVHICTCLNLFLSINIANSIGEQTIRTEQ